MIAQVFTSKVPAGPLSDERRKFLEDAVAGSRTQDGVEANCVVVDPATGDGVTMILFRDQAAFEAFQAWAQGTIAKAGELGVEVVTARVYSDVIASM